MLTIAISQTIFPILYKTSVDQTLAKKHTQEDPTTEKIWKDYLQCQNNNYLGLNL